MAAQRNDAVRESWISGHLHYHQGFLPVVQGFIQPLVASQVKEGAIDGFFFVRHGLGGPHIRLRLRVLPAARKSALAAMQRSARRFLELEFLAGLEAPLPVAHEAIPAGLELLAGVVPGDERALPGRRMQQHEMLKLLGLRAIQADQGDFPLRCVEVSKARREGRDLDASQRIGGERRIRRQLGRASGHEAQEALLPLLGASQLPRSLGGTEP